ncbi:MAG: HlyD family type I secretion periplasmic adaptor subunit [Pleurocapsa sp.]
MPLQVILSGIAFFLVFGIWAWLGEIEQIGTAQGKLVPKGETYKVESLELGKVSQIAVKEGEEVSAGQIIAQLDTTLAKNEVARLQQMLEAYQGELTQKQTLLQQVILEAQTHKKIALAETLGQKSAIASARDKAEVLSQLLTQQKQEMSAYQAREKRLNSMSDLAQTRSQQLESELVAHQQRMERLKPMEVQGAVSKEFIFQAEQARLQTQQQLIESKLQEISNINEQIFQSEQSLRDLVAKITQTQGELSTATKEVEQLEADLTRNQAERTRLELQAQQQIEGLKLEISQIKSKIAETQNTLANAQTQLEQKFLKSPVDGVVLSFNVKNTGKVVQSGQTVAEIAPEDSPLVLSALIPNQNAGFIKTDMPVQIKLDAYSYQDYGTIPGKVISISGDTKANEQLGAVYQVEIELERDYITNDRQVVKFKPGQTATANIIIRQRKVLDLFLDPIKKLQQDGIDL